MIAAAITVVMLFTTAAAPAGAAIADGRCKSPEACTPAPAP